MLSKIRRGGRLSKYERREWRLQKLIPERHAGRVHHPTPHHVPRNVPVQGKANGAVEVRAAATSLTSELNGYRRSLIGSSLSARKTARATGPCPPTPSCVPSPPPVSPGLRCRTVRETTPLPRGRAGISASELPVSQSLCRNPRLKKATPRGVWPEPDRGAGPRCAPFGRRGRGSRPAQQRSPRPSGCAQTGSWRVGRCRA